MGITDEYNPSEGQLAEHENCTLMYLNVRMTLSAFIPFSALMESISISELCQTALQQLHMLIIKVALSLKM